VTIVTNRSLKTSNRLPSGTLDLHWTVQLGSKAPPNRGAEEKNPRHHYKSQIAVSTPPSFTLPPQTLDPCPPPDGGGRGGVPGDGAAPGAVPRAAARGGRRGAERRCGGARLRRGAPRAHLQLQARHHRAHHHRRPARRARRQGHRQRHLRPGRRGRSSLSALAVLKAVFQNYFPSLLSVYSEAWILFVPCG
jgi:hypothetical protein